MFISRISSTLEFAKLKIFLILTLYAIAENKETNRPEFRVTATVFEDEVETVKKETDEKTEKKDEKEEVKEVKKTEETAKKVVEKTFVDTTARGVWHQILVLLEKMRKENNMVSVFPR